MGSVVRKYIDFLIILLIPTPLVLALFLQQHPYFFVHLKNVFSFFEDRVDSMVVLYQQRLGLWED